MINLKRFAAYACIVGGAAGLALPLLPGIPLLILGAGLLGPEHRVAKPLYRFMHWVRRPR